MFRKLLLFVLLVACAEREGTDTHTIPKGILRRGDIVFRCGDSAASQLVLFADKESAYSHTGIVDFSAGQWWVIHAVPGERDNPDAPDRIKREGIDSFFACKKAKKGAIMRIKGDTIAPNAATDKAFELFTRGTLFDHLYDSHDTTSMYCTELIVYAYRKSGIKLLEDEGTYLNLPGLPGTYFMPSDIQKCKELDLIYSF